MRRPPSTGTKRPHSNPRTVRGLHRRAHHDERGEIASALILTPIVVFSVMLAIQGALVFHARSIVQTAAQDAARATQAQNATIADGQAAGEYWVSDGGLLIQPSVVVQRTATEVQVTVTSGVQSLVPFWQPTVVATVVGPVEVFRPENERQ